jgi:hypothetical protein
MNFVKLIQFTRLVKVDGRLREFNFRKLRSAEGGLFSVNVCNERGDRILFNMEKQDAGWRIQPNELPLWVVQSEKKLDEVIEDELANPTPLY